MARTGEILIVDDEEGVRAFVGDALKRSGHTVVLAADGEEALAQLCQRGFDLVVTDLKMPKVDGLELLQRAKTLQPEVEVIVMTAHGSVQTAIEAMKEGAFEYLQKPLSGPSELRILVERALERKALVALKERYAPSDAETPITYGAPAMVPFVRALEKVAPTHATVLLLGPSGAGKELCAQRIHDWSPRREAPFVAINCAALTDTLLESTLFGHEKGAFTGADRRQRGQFELAQGGTFFLDEIGELKLELQAKLLRVLEERTFQRLGGHQQLSADIRFVAATNRDLMEMLQAGKFREDLYHRLAVFPLRLPSLEERREDIPGIAAVLLRAVAQEMGRPGLSFSDAVIERFVASSWPGNIRQLRNTIERAVILCDGSVIDVLDIWDGASIDGAPASDALRPARTLAAVEREAVLSAMARHDGNRAAAAEELGISVRSLYDRLRRLAEPHCGPT